MNLLKLLRATLALFILFLTFLFSSGKAQPYGFIAQKHPECVSLSKQPYEDDHIATYTEAVQAGPQAVLQIFKSKIHNPKLFNTKEEAQNSLTMEKEFLNTQELSKRFKHPFFKILENIKFKSDIAIGFDILLSALQLDYQLRILSKEQHESVGVIFLGRTPYFYQMFLEAIQENHPHHYSNEKQYTPLQDEGFDFIHLAYSGHPDAISIRNNHRHEKKPSVLAANLLNEQRLNHFLSYMRSKNLHTYDRLVIVDLIGTGSGMSRFLSILQVFRNKMNITYKAPLLMQLTSISTSLFMKNFEALYVRNECFYHFKEDKKHNYEKHCLPFIEIHSTMTALDICTDNPAMQYVASGVSCYHAQRWSPEYDARRDAGGPLKDAVRSALTPMIQSWLTQYNRLYQAAL